MKISNVLQERRRLLGLTQEEVAEYLGVTTPAVNKWEKGSTCPDISLLAPLARLLKTDLNTLLGFYEEITEQELISICKAIREAVLANGLDAGFAIAQEQIRQYPNSDTLLYNSALQLQSLLAAAALTEDQVKAYMKQIEAWYERLAKCEDPVIRNNVCFILAGSAIARKEYEKAQAYLEGIPCRESMPDKRLLQAAIDLGQDRAGEAAKRLEQALLRSLNDVQMILYKLIDANLALGDQKTALFLIMSDTDSTFNFLISMIYTQLFNLLCEKADDVYGGRLPVHVRCLIDEAANIGQIPNLEKLVATIRSREISACLVLQARSQLKALYKDNADTIIGNMDSQIFLGGSEPTTLKELNTALGKETIDMFTTSDTRGNSPSYGTNYQKTGHDLASIDELAVLDGGKCILQLRGVRPFLSDKYDLTQHPNYKYTSDYDKKNTFDIEKFLNRKLKLKKGDVFTVVDADGT